MVKEIPLQNGMVALVDDEDYERVSRYIWYVETNRDTTIRIRGMVEGRKTHLSHFILGLKKNDEVLFLDGNRLNYSKINMRVSTDKEITRNARSQRGSSSKYKGVYLKKRTNNWGACIYPNKKQVHLGYFPSEDEAAKAYNRAALHFYGENAFLNVIGEDNRATEVEVEKVEQRRSKGKCKFKGVYSKRQKYVAQIHVNRKPIYLGSFATQEQAASVYDRKAYELYGDKAILNFPERIEEYKEGNDEKIYKRV